MKNLAEHEEAQGIAGRCALAESELICGRWPRRADRQLLEALGTVLDAARQFCKAQQRGGDEKNEESCEVSVEAPRWVAMGSAGRRDSMLGSRIRVNGAELGLLAIAVTEDRDGRLRCVQADDAAALEAMLSSFDVGAQRFTTGRVGAKGARYAFFAAPLPDATRDGGQA
jgi:hypothetical protein